MIPRVALIFLLLIGGSFATEETYDSGFEPVPTSPFPAKFRDYQILPGTFSPDKKLALIYPKRSRLYELTHYGLYLAQVKPFRIVTRVPLAHSSLTGNTHGSYDVNWAKDSSAVVVIEGIKWGPDKVFLIPLHSGKPQKIVDLTAEVRKRVQRDFEKARAERFNEVFDFIFLNDPPDTDTWRIEDAKVIIECICTTDPKELDPHRWAVRFKGTWDISKGRFAQKEFARIPLRPNLTMQRTSGRSAFNFAMISTFHQQRRSPSPAVADLRSR